MRYLLITIFIINFTLLHSQSKQDYIWFFGLDEEPNVPGTQAYSFDFNIKPFKVLKSENGIGFAQNNASICDKDGNLLFYSNGCAVLNSEAKIMPKGDSLNYNIWQELSGHNRCEYGYPGTQNIMILNDPGNENEYYIIHKPRVFESWENNSMKYLWYSKVDMNLDNGKGDVIKKNIDLYSERQSLSSYLTAIKHVNKKDWWIIQPLQDSNIYARFLLDETGIHKETDQSIGKVFDWNASASGTAKFSPDGKKYAYYNESDGLLLFDFDRITGLLSNYQRVVPFDTTGQGIFCSVEWSPNSRFVYTATETKLHQIDTWEENLPDGVHLIGVYDGTKNPFSNTFFLMAQGPDCRIYMCSTSGNKTYHVINKPDELGAACDFVQNGIKLPYEAGFGSMPNFPRFRVDEAEKCDPTIVSVFGDYVWYRRDIKVWPNPSSGLFNIELPDVGAGKLVVTNINGQVVYSIEVTDFDDQFQRINISYLPAGRYNVEFWPERQSKLQTSTIAGSKSGDFDHRVFYGGQVVIVKN